MGSAHDHDWQIRQARTDDLDELARVELDATISLLEARGDADEEPSATPLHLLEGALAENLLLVAVDRSDTPIGFVAGAERDGLLYVGEIDVARMWQRRGIGRALMTSILGEGQSRSLAGAMLTTDREVPFNAPFYATLGFRMLENSDMPPSLGRVIAAERQEETGPSRRVAMMLRF